ncbi:MAG: aldolase/citrate lyase family protein [Thiovulaceae bacterium]|nr:aldolase/citrate lyase family protein [Sulfurimonadaceae bacterium]
MLIRDSHIIADALQRQDLALLDEFVFAQKRTINRGQDYRSPLMLSAHNLKHINKIPELSTDAVILNLEDGVSPQQKPFALRLVMLALSSLRESDKKIIVRVNALDEGGEDEIALLNSFKPDAIRVPKVRTEADVRKALKLCDKEIELHLSIETKEAWLNLANLKVNGRVTTFYLGILDLFADMGLSQELIRSDNPLMQQILAHFLLTCKAIGVKPVSFVYQEYKNQAGFEAWLELERRMGYDAKGCISPQQTEQLQKSFGLSGRERARARAEYIIRRFEEERAKGITGFCDEQYGFIDEPVYKGALALLR